MTQPTRAPHNREDMIFHMLQDMSGNVNKLDGKVDGIIQDVNALAVNFERLRKDISDDVEKKTIGVFPRLAVLETKEEETRDKVDKLDEAINNDKRRLLGSISAATVAIISAIVTALIAAAHGTK